MPWSDKKIGGLKSTGKRKNYASGEGLFLSVSATNDSKSWFLKVRSRRYPGKIRNLGLGKWPNVKLADAKTAAIALKERIRSGEEPAIQAEAPAVDENRLPETVGELVPEFIERYAKRQTRPKSWHEAKRLLDSYLVPALGNRRLEDTKQLRGEFVKLLERIVADGKHATANRLLSHTRKMFNWAVESSICEASPCDRVRARGKEKSRDRVLSADELGRVLHTAQWLEYPWGPFVRLLLMTAQRRDEVANMEWSEVDFETGIWTIPAERSKNRIPHAVPLPAKAVLFLSQMKGMAGAEFRVFPSQSRASDACISGFSKMKRQMDKGSGVTEWVLHDLRRSFATHAQRLGVRLEVIESVLGHVSGSRSGVVGIYQRHQFLDESREALEKWGKFLSQSLATFHRRSQVNAVNASGADLT
jgi:integrase